MVFQTTLLIVATLITYNIYSLLLNKALSESMALVLLMTSYLAFNDDLLVLNFSNFNNSIINDYFAFFTKMILCLFSAFYFLIVASFLKEQKLTSFEYLLILLFAVLGLLLMCSSNDLLTAYLAIELLSLGSYILASFRKTSSYSVESGLKYFVTGAVSSAFFLLGSTFIYGLTGSINFSDFRDLFECDSFYYPKTSDCAYQIQELIRIIKERDYDTSIPNNYCMHKAVLGDLLVELWNEIDKLPSFAELFNYNFLEFGLTLILFSLFIKLSLAPFHVWSLDVYEGSPTSSTFFFAVLAKLSFFVLLIRLCYQSFFSLYSGWQFYCLWIGSVGCRL